MKKRRRKVPVKGDGKYHPEHYIQLGAAAVAHLFPEISTPLERRVAALMSCMRVRDIFDEVESAWPPERLKTPEQVAIAIQEVLFNNYEDQLLKLIGHRIPV